MADSTTPDGDLDEVQSEALNDAPLDDPSEGWTPPPAFFNTRSGPDGVVVEVSLNAAQLAELGATGLVRTTHRFPAEPTHDVIEVVVRRQ